MPVHPMLVHLPIALAVLMPLVSAGLLIAWWRGALLGDHLTTLAEAGIAVLTTSVRLPPVPIGARLLAGVATWWIHSINPADRARLQPHLQSWGVPGDLLFTRLPGVALLKLPGADGPIVATVRPPTGEGA